MDEEYDDLSYNGILDMLDGMFGMSEDVTNNIDKTVEGEIL